MSRPLHFIPEPSRSPEWVAERLEKIRAAKRMEGTLSDAERPKKAPNDTRSRKPRRRPKKR